MNPKLAICNIFSDVDKLRKFALDHGFSGVDWSFEISTLPETSEQESAWLNGISALAPLEVRYHCPFYRIDLGHEDPSRARLAEMTFCWIIELVSRVKGRYLTIHIGLGRDSTEPLSWEATTDNLARVVEFGRSHGVRVCLENLAWGTNLTLGAGYKPSDSSRIDYAFIYPVNTISDTLGSHRVSIVYNFGQ